MNKFILMPISPEVLNKHLSYCKNEISKVFYALSKSSTCRIKVFYKIFIGNISLESHQKWIMIYLENLHKNGNASNQNKNNIQNSYF